MRAQGRRQCQPFASSLGTKGVTWDWSCDRNPLRCPREHRTNTRHEVRKDETCLELSWHQHASESGLIHLVLTTWVLPAQPGFLAAQAPCCLLPPFPSEHQKKKAAYHFPWFPPFPSQPPADPNTKSHWGDCAKSRVKIFHVYLYGKANVWLGIC